MAKGLNQIIWIESNKFVKKISSYFLTKDVFVNLYVSM